MIYDTSSRRHYNLSIQYMNKELIISVTQSIPPGSGSGRSGRTGLLIPAGHGVQLDGVHSLHDGLGSGDRDLSPIIRFVLLRIQSNLDHESLSCDPLRLSIYGDRSFDKQVLCLRDGWEYVVVVHLDSAQSSSSVSQAASSDRGRSAVTAVPVSSALLKHLEMS